MKMNCLYVYSKNVNSQNVYSHLVYWAKTSTLSGVVGWCDGAGYTSRAGASHLLE